MEALHSGTLLCELANAIQPGIIAGSAHMGRAVGFKSIENVGKFLEACRGLGLRQDDLFEVNDLINRKNPSQARDR